MKPEFRIPGTLEKSSDSCNTFVGAEYCKDCGRSEARFYHCNNWDCPECYFFTATRAARRTEDRLRGVQIAYSNFGRFPGKTMHVTFSVPDSEYDSFDLDKSWRTCIKYADMIGINGGAVIFHPYRIKSEFKKRIFDAVKAACLKGGLWSGVHNNVLNLGSWQDYVYFAPHFHVLGYYPKIVMKSNVFHEATGWVYKAIRVGQKRDVFATARYLYTHTAVPEGHKQAVHYFGIASYSKTSVESIKTKEFKKCPECGSKDYYLLSGYSSATIERLFIGEWKPSEQELFSAHYVLVTKAVKRYTVRWKCELSDFIEVVV